MIHVGHITFIDIQDSSGNLVGELDLDEFIDFFKKFPELRRKVTITKIMHYPIVDPNNLILISNFHT